MRRPLSTDRLVGSTFFPPLLCPRRLWSLASRDAAQRPDFTHNSREPKLFDLGFHLGRVLIAERSLGQIRRAVIPANVEPARRFREYLLHPLRIDVAFSVTVGR